MPRPRKESKVLNIRLSKDVSDKLEQFCSESCTPKTLAVENILNQYLDKYFEKPEEERKLFN